MVRHSSDSSVIGARSQITGRVGGTGALRIEGTLSGDVAVSGPVEIVAGGSVDGDVSGSALEIAGKLQGDANCQGPIVVRASAEVRGELKGTSVAIEPGSRVDVRLDTDFTLDLGGRR
ncbi:MAG: polymer-forming cytoskeletal protein [Myxococcales bacterium]|nr:polymer-forming cytoskeletal protein [Myxococcales bacterium]